MKRLSPDDMMKRKYQLLNMDTLKAVVPEGTLKGILKDYCVLRDTRQGHPITEFDVQMFDKYQAGKIDLVGLQKAFQYKGVNSVLMKLGKVMHHLYSVKKSEKRLAA